MCDLIVIGEFIRFSSTLIFYLNQFVSTTLKLLIWITELHKMNDFDKIIFP